MAKVNGEIPAGRKVQGGMTDRLISGEFSEIDLSMFARMKGRTVVIVGHIEGKGDSQAFEIVRSDGERRYLPISSLNKAARELGFNFFPLGCETNKSAATGTVGKINDLDAIDAYIRTASRGGVSSYGEFIADLSSHDIQIAFDVARIGNGDMLPIEVLSSKDHSYSGYPANLASVSPANSNGMSINVASVEKYDNTEQECGFGDPSVYEVSRWINLLQTEGMRIWVWGVVVLVGTCSLAVLGLWTYVELVLPLKSMARSDTSSVGGVLAKMMAGLLSMIFATLGLALIVGPSTAAMVALPILFFESAGPACCAVIALVGYIYIRRTIFPKSVDIFDRMIFVVSKVLLGLAFVPLVLQLIWGTAHATCHAFSLHPIS